MWNPRWILLASDWTPGSKVSAPESNRQVTVIALLFVSQGWIPSGVASQKKRSDTGDMPRFAPQHTVANRRDPFIFNGLRGATFWVETVFLNVRLPSAGSSNSQAALKTEQESSRHRAAL